MSGMNLGVIGLHGLVNGNPAGFSNTHVPIDYSLSRGLHMHRADARFIRARAAYAAYSSGDAERTRTGQFTGTERWCSGHRGRRRQIGATRSESITRTQD